MKKIKEIGKFIGVFVLYFLLINILNSLFMSDVLSTNKLLSNLANIAISLITITVFIFIYHKTFIKDIYKINKNVLETGLKYWLLGYGIMYISNIILYLISGGLPVNEEQNRELIFNNLLYSIINMSIMAPIIEELIFRRGLRNIFNNKYFYAITSGLVFGALHLITEIFIDPNILLFLYIIPYGALGFAFALAYYESDNIFSSIIFHAVHNSMAIVLLLIIG